MKISIVQADIAWEDKEANFSKYESILKNADNDTDLVVLPEMFNTGFSMNSHKLAEDLDGPTFNWMRKMSSDGDYGLMGSFIVNESGKFYNRLVFMKPDGSWTTYDKAHLFRMEKENEFYEKGKRPVIEAFRSFNFSLQICYDLRFPVWSRNRNNAYDVLVYVANWPASRRKVWNTLLAARAIENQSYVVGVNRIGRDGNGIDYFGDSVIIDPRGNVVAAARDNTEEVVSMDISLDDLKHFREKFPVWLDADNFSILSE